MVWAASSYSGGTLTNTLAVMSTVNGRARAVWTAATAQMVSSSPTRRKNTASGIDRMTTGKARVDRITSR